MLQRANILDESALSYTKHEADTARRRIWRDGALKRDGSEDRSGTGRESIYENGVAAVMLPFEKEIEEARDAAFQTAYKNNSGDFFRNTKKRDGALPRNGAAPRSNDIIDAYVFKHTASAFQEEAAMGEELTVGIRKHHYRDGTYLRDGSILHDSMMLLPL
jgi:hypothetical protein